MKQISNVVRGIPVRFWHKSRLFKLCVLGVFLLVILSSVAYGKLSNRAIVAWDDVVRKSWPDGFTRTTVSDHGQGAYFRWATGGAIRPLVISLHTWSGNFEQRDPLADSMVRNNWNYIHPDLGGPNNHPGSCLSANVIRDLDDAIDFAIKSGKVDASKIFVVGVSGGGYTALGAWLRSKYRSQLAGVIAWASITDLDAWYGQSRLMKTSYHSDIMKCTASVDKLDRQEAKDRSPLYWPLAERPFAPLKIYAGLDDGFSGSVPISHSILFYNRLAREFGHPFDQVDATTALHLMSRSAELSADAAPLAGRNVFLKRSMPGIDFQIFDGGHEMLPEQTVADIVALSR